MTVLYRRERWQLPDGSTIVALLPAGITTHFGPELKRFVLAQYTQGQTTMPRLLALLQDLGVVISKRQLVRLLIAGQDVFLDEARDVLRSGLDAAAWITVDDTWARHKAQNGVCIHIGNDQFAAFVTTRSNGRLNFFESLDAGDTTHLINDAALVYMREHDLSGKVIALLAGHAATRFADRATWITHLKTLGITALDVNPNRSRRNRRCPVGRALGAGPDRGHCHRLRRRRPVQYRPPRRLLGACGAPGAQAGRL